MPSHEDKELHVPDSFRNFDKRTLLNASLSIAVLLLFFAAAITLPSKNSVLGSFFRKLLSHAQVATPTHVQSQIASNGNTVPSLSVAFTNTVTTGDLVVVAISTWNGTNTASVTGVTDNFGNTYTKAVEDPTPNTNAVEPLSIWYAKNVTGGSNFMVTATTQAASSITEAIHEYSGVDKVSPLDQVSHLSATGTQGLSGTVTTTQDSELLFGAFNQTNGSVVTGTAGTGFTIRQSQTDNNSFEALFTEDQTVSAIGSYQATLGFGSSVTYRGTLLTFKADTSGTASPTPAQSTPTPAPVSSTSFSMNVAGFNDNISKAIVRTNTDRVYVFAGQDQYTTNIKAYWTPNPGYPSSAADFSGTTTVNAGANVITVDGVYDGANTVHVLAPDMSGSLKDYPFDLTTNTFKPAITIATGDPTVSGDYIGTEGVSGMVDTSGNLHIAYWSGGNHITYRQYTYDSANNALNLISGPTQIDTAGSANHPVLAISPVDGLVTIAWVSQAASPAQILTRTRDNTGTWSTVQLTSTGNVWTSLNSGVNIDQGPTLLIDSNNNKHLVYMENFDSTGQYGKQHYVLQTAGSGTWTDTPTSFYSHATGLGIDPSGTLYIIGHGLSTDASPCQSNLDMCYIKKPAGGSWSAPILVMTHTGSNSLDSGASVKWGVVGYNKPEAVEYIYFQANSGSYNNTTLFYGRFGTSGGSTPTNTPTPTLGGPTATPTNTPTPSNTPTPTATATPTPIPGQQNTVTLQISSGSNDVNQDNGNFTSGGSTVWVGVGQSASASYTGLRFTGVGIPRGATIVSAKLQVYSSQSQWLNMSTVVGIDNVGNSAAFGTGSKPSQRILGTTKVTYTDNSNWTANTWFTSPELKTVLQQVISRSDWNAGNSMSLVLKGSGGAYSRKFVKSFEAGSTTAPILVVTYQ